MKIIIPGGSGQVGTVLARAWRVMPWDGQTIGAWSKEHGFVFKYPFWPDAARDLCHAVRTART